MDSSRYEKPPRSALTSAEVHRAELHAGGFRAMLDVARDALGAEPLAALVAGLGVTVAEVTDPTAWFSLHFAEELFDRLVEASDGDPKIIDQAARALMSPKYMGPIYPLYRALGTPTFTYTHLMPTARRTNRTGEYVVDELSRGHVVVHFRMLEGFHERNPWMCRMRSTLLTLGPVLFDLPPALVKHERCMSQGASECVYDVQWKERPRQLGPWLVAGAMALLVGGGAAFEGIGTFWCVALALLSGSAVIAASKMKALRSELRDRVKDIEEHRDALTRSEVAAEKRYDELLEAKAAVDEKVEVRTAELRETGKKLEETLGEVRALDRAKTDFFNNVSHELRTPLTLILAPLEELLSGHEPVAGTQASLFSIQRNAMRLLRLINQLLDLAKIDAGEMRISRTLVDLGQVVNGIVRNFEPAARQREVSLRVDAALELKPLALDQSWIESALTNLLANALRFVPVGGEVVVRIKELGNSVSLEVADNGPGMSAADAARIFERFAQGGDTHAGRKGTGLGLAIVREAARLHGGDVSLRTGLGEGATFVIDLPRVYDAGTASSSGARLATRSPTRDVDIDALTRSPTSVEPQSSTRPGPTPDASLALVVEDNPDLRRHIADVLAARYRVRTVPNGAEGVRVATELLPDVIVSDVAMPEMDGYELCRALRAQERTRHIPILLVTARSDVAHVVEGFHAGANDYVVKPFHATELLARVDVHVRLRRVLAQLARQERLAALGSLAASVAHHVRNPLSALISGLPAVQSRLGAALDAPSRELMDIMLECAVRIERTTLDLLDLSRVDREEEGDFSPGAGLLACARILSSRLSPDVELCLDVDETAVLVGRAGDMNNVFMNLVDNALRAVGDKGVIEVCGKMAGDDYVVTVADSGAGVDPASVDRIFEPFWTTRAAGEGTGLGLSIAKQIVEEHGGTIRVGSSAHGGALFTLRIPMRRAPRMSARSVA